MHQKKKRNPVESPSSSRETKCVWNFNNPLQHSFKYLPSSLKGQIEAHPAQHLCGLRKSHAQSKAPMKSCCLSDCSPVDTWPARETVPLALGRKSPGPRCGGSKAAGCQPLLASPVLTRHLSAVRGPQLSPSGCL